MRLIITATIRPDLSPEALDALVRAAGHVFDVVAKPAIESSYSIRTTGHPAGEDGAEYADIRTESVNVETDPVVAGISTQPWGWKNL